MTAKIQQNVAPRHRRQSSSIHFINPSGSWQTRSLRTSRFFSSAKANNLQRGSVTESTLTMSLILVLLVALSLLGFFYLQQVFDTASQGTDIQALEVQIGELKQKQRESELEGAKLRSIQEIDEKVKELNLVKTKQVAYLTMPQQERVALSR